MFAALVALVATALMPALAAPSVKIGGYVQVRFTDTLGAKDDGAIDGIAKGVSGFGESSSFGLRRARLSVKATLDEHSLAALEIDMSKSGVETKKAYLAYQWQDLYFVAGRDTIPFGYELQLSSSGLTTLERSMISQTLPEYATGLKITPGSVYLPLKTTVGIFNGNDPAKSIAVSGASGSVNSFEDTNNNKVLSVTTELPVGDHKIGASYLTDLGGHTATAGYATASIGKIGLSAEYIASEFDKYMANLGAPQNHGYYLQVAYAVKPTTTVYARYDSLNNAIIAEKTRTTVGAAVQLTDNTELTLEYQMIDDPAKAALDGAVGVQLQGKF
ncbi:MAG: Phosphate-selective porin O and P [bacterium ADurb.Bin429]|nr:MAG: Phosphate-selective porin O and P [bacterium ADurb.Bin429]